MPDVQVRIHKEWCDVSGFIHAYAEKAKVVFAFEHPADDEVARTHTHAYFFGLSVKRASLSEAIAKKFDLEGQKEFFTKEECSKGKNTRALDISGAYTYGTKDDAFPPLFTKGLTPEEVTLLKVYAYQWWMLHPKRSKNRQVDTQIVIVKPSHKETQSYHVDKIIDAIYEKYDTMIDEWEQKISMDTVAEEVYNYLAKNNIWCGVMKSHDYIENTLKRMNSQMYKTRVLALWSQKIFRKV